MWLVVILEWSVLRCVCKRGSCQFLKRKNITFKYIPVYIFTMYMMPVKVHLQVRVVLNLQYWVFHYSKVAIDVHAHYTPKCLTSCFKNKMQSFSQYLTTLECKSEFSRHNVKKNVVVCIKSQCFE